MKIATIVSSNSHLDYLARVVDKLDVKEPPGPDDFGFGRFVICGEESVAIVYNSLLVNPDYASFGPRLSSDQELAGFSPDFLDERGIILVLAIVGRMSAGDFTQDIPSVVIPAGSVVRQMNDEEFVDFHSGHSAGLRMGYLPGLISQAGEFALPLVESISAQIKEKVEVDSDGVKRLDTLNRSLKWQRTMDHLRL